MWFSFLTLAIPEMVVLDGVPYAVEWFHHGWGHLEDPSFRLERLPDRPPGAFRCGDATFEVSETSGNTRIVSAGTGRMRSEVHAGDRFNAISYGPSCDPDGRIAAIPTPYAGTSTFVRVSDGSVIAVLAGMDGIAWVGWGDGVVTLHTFNLPYE